MITTAPTQKTGFRIGKVKCLFTNKLKEGNKRKTATTEKRKAINARIIDSEKNCIINCFLSEPNVFLTPTSFALFSERAVERFMKFTQAINKIINAIIVKSLTYSIMPPTFFPSLKSLYNLHLLIGNAK